MTTVSRSQPTSVAIGREQLLQAFDTLLQPERFTDYGPNGLQVEGKPGFARSSPA